MFVNNLLENSIVLFSELTLTDITCSQHNKVLSTSMTSFIAHRHYLALRSNYAQSLKKADRQDPLIAMTKPIREYSSLTNKSVVPAFPVVTPYEQRCSLLFCNMLTQNNEYI